MHKEELDQELIKIANRCFVTLVGRQDLESRNNDSEDFYDVAIWELKAALLAAYELGRRKSRIQGAE